MITGKKLSSFLNQYCHVFKKLVAPLPCLAEWKSHHQTYVLIPCDISTLVALVRRQTEEIDLLRKEVRGQAKIPQLNSRSNQGDFSSQKDFTVKFDRLANEMKQFQRNIANQLK